MPRSIREILGFLDDEKKARQQEIIAQAARRREILRNLRVYNTQDGRRVLADALFDLGLLRPLVGIEDIARHNAAITMLEKAGVSFVDPETRILLVETLFSRLLEKIKEQENTEVKE